MRDDDLHEIVLMENTNPEAFDQLASKKRWTAASKDPTRAFKDPSPQVFSHLNNMSKKQIN